MMHVLRNIILIIIACVLIIYAVLWLSSIKKYPVEYGISFDRDHASYLGLDWKKTYLAMLDDLKPKYIRLSARWDEIEKVRGKFNTADLDWQMLEAAKHRAKVVMVVGQKTPRWPECHIPEWASHASLEEYVKYVVEKYKNHPALDIWQVENEPFIDFKFGECKNFDEGLVAPEVAFVKSLDNKHKIMLTDSGEMGFWRGASRLGDILGTTVYRIVKTPGGHLWSYGWLPAGVYKLKARLLDNSYENFYVSELQAEPWMNGAHPNDVSILEQEKTMSITRLQNALDYTSRIGASRAYLWGVEWWYWMKEKKGDTQYWDLMQNLLE